MDKVVYVLKCEERDEIEKLYEKKLALENLIKIIDMSNESVYNKLISDYGKVMHEYMDWWKKMSTFYHWEGENWSVNFESNEIILIS